MTIIILILVGFAGICISVGCFLFGFHMGETSFDVRMKIALLKEENARLKCMMTIARSSQRIAKALKETQTHAK